MTLHKKQHIISAAFGNQKSEKIRLLAKADFVWCSYDKRTGYTASPKSNGTSLLIFV